MNGSKMPSLFDLHCDTAHELYQRKALFESNALHIDLDRLCCYERAVQVFAVWTPDTLKGKSRFDNACQVIDNFVEQVMQNEDRVALCCTYDQIVQAHQEGKVAAILSIEGAGAFDGAVENIDALYQKGVRIVTVTWNGPNELACGVPDEGGLTAFGRRALDHMAKLGMIVDLSHANRQSFDEICEYYQGPLMASHSNAYEVWAHPRNLTPEQREKIGLIGVNLYPKFVKKQAVLADILPHFEVICPEKTALGCDFDGVDALPKGVEGVQDMQELYHLLTGHFDQTYANQVFFENAMKFMKTYLR